MGIGTGICASVILSLAVQGQAQEIDLLIKNGHVFDPKNGLDTVQDISITDGKILQVAPNIEATAKKVVDATGLYVSPGLIDIHTHTYSLLVAHEVPSEGGKTEFADARACYDDWPGPFDGMGKDALEDLVCEHSIIYSRSAIVGDIFTALMIWDNRSVLHRGLAYNPAQRRVMDRATVAGDGPLI